MEKDLEIRIEDRYGENCLVDRLKGEVKSVSLRRPSGFVEIYEIDEDGKKKLIGKSNLVLYVGREWVASRSFNIINPSIIAQPNEFICWFGIGSGGCRPGDPFDPIPPTNLDTGLGTEVPVNPTNSLCADFHDGNYYKHPFDGVTVLFEQDPDNYDAWLIAKVTVTLLASDAINQQINECGLFTATSNVGGLGNTGPFHIYSKVTFPTIVKTISRQLIFVWYIYF